MRTASNWYQIDNRTYYILKVRKFYVEKRYPCQQTSNCRLWHVNVYFTDQSRMQRGDSMELNVEGLEMQKEISQLRELEE